MWLVFKTCIVVNISTFLIIDNYSLAQLRKKEEISDVKAQTRLFISSNDGFCYCGKMSIISFAASINIDQRSAVNTPLKISRVILLVLLLI